MVTYTVENDEILISFDRIPSEEIRNKMKSLSFRWAPQSKVWHAPISQEREELANSLVTGTTSFEVVPSPTNQIPDDATIEAVVDRYYNSNSSTEKNILREWLSHRLTSDVDNFAEAIRKYKEQEFHTRHQRQLGNSRNDEDEDSSNLKDIRLKRNFLERIALEYLRSNNLDILSGNEYNISFKEKQTYTLSPEAEEEIRQSVQLPSWVSIEVKINQKALEQMDNLPEEISISSTRKIVVWSKDEQDPRISSYQLSLKAFNEGMSIDEIRQSRNFARSTVEGHLLRAINTGELGIHAYVPERVMNELDSLRSHSDQWSLSDFMNAIGYKLSLDWTSLALRFLRIRTKD
mgnify:CR=1 FL=1